MLTELKKFFSNIVSSTGAIASSAATLITQDAPLNIINPLAFISIIDFLPAALAYLLNEEIQNYSDEYLDEHPLKDFSTIVMLTTATLSYVALNGFMINRLINGSVRTLALTRAIPLLINEVPGPFETAEPCLLNSRMIRINSERIHESIQLVRGRILDMSIDMLLPEHHLVQAFSKIMLGYEIIELAGSKQTLQRLRQLKNNSVPLLVGGLYMVSTALINTYIVQNSSNIYLKHIINNVIFTALLAVVANLNIQNTELQTEPYSLNPSNLLEYLPNPNNPVRSLYKYLKQNGSIEHVQTIISNMILLEINLSKITWILPQIVHSPSQFFDDRVITHLLRSLPQEVRDHLSSNFTKPQAKTLIGHLEFLATKTFPPTHTQRIYNALSCDTLIDAMQRKLNSITPALGQHGIFARTDIGSPIEYVPNQIRQRI